MALQHTCIAPSMPASTLTDRAKSLPARKLPQAQLCMGKLLVWIWNGGSKRTHIFPQPQGPASPGRRFGKAHLKMAGSKAAIKSTPCVSQWKGRFERRGSGYVATVCVCVCVLKSTWGIVCYSWLNKTGCVCVCLEKSQSEGGGVSLTDYIE